MDLRSVSASEDVIRDPCRLIITHFIIQHWAILNSYVDVPQSTQEVTRMTLSRKVHVLSASH